MKNSTSRHSANANYDFTISNQFIKNTHSLFSKGNVRLCKLILLAFIMIGCLSCQKKFTLHRYSAGPYEDLKNMQFSTFLLKKSEDSKENYAFHSIAKKTSDTASLSLLGAGYNSVTGELLAPEVVVSQEISTDNHGGIEQQVTKATMVTSYNELISSMQSSGSASIGFSIFSASAQLKAIHDIHTSSSSSYLIYRTSINQYTRELKVPTFSSDTDVTNKLNNYGEFFGFAGDEYVYQETFGGYLYIIFAAEAHSKAESEKNSSSFSAATTFLNLGGSANISSAITSIKEVSSMQMFIYQNGGEAFTSDSTETTITELFKYAQNFGESVKAHPTLIAYNTKQYQTARKFPVGFQGDPQIRDYKSYMNNLIGKMLKIGALMGDLEFTTRNSDLFKVGFADSVAHFNAPLSRQLSKLQYCANQCRSEYSVPNCSDCDALHYDSVNYILAFPPPKLPQ